MDELMLPIDTPAKLATALYDCAKDVLALPGGYKKENEEDNMVEDLWAFAQGDCKLDCIYTLDRQRATD